MTPQRVPIVTVEEHHEAFYVWHYGIRNGWMGSAGNTLLHADHHSDLSVPRLRRSLNSIKDMPDLADFTYQELDIASFIWPAVYQGIFSRMLWLRDKHTSEKTARTGFVWQNDVRGTTFQTGWAQATKTKPLPDDTRSIELVLVDPVDSLRTDQPIVLDIDLDYFCCNVQPRGVFELEVTQAAYLEFVNNPYHFLKLPPSNKAFAECRDGRFYLVFNDMRSEAAPEFQKADLDARIQKFTGYLRLHNAVPSLVVVCRSIHSGYTPADSGAYVESRLLEELTALYAADTFYISEILPIPSNQGAKNSYVN
jgi:hypothetical protein